MALFLFCDLITVYTCDIKERAQTVFTSGKNRTKGKPTIHSSMMKYYTYYILGKPFSRQQSQKSEDSDPLFIKQRIPKSFKAITFNALFYFLLSNVCTGLVNFSLKTIEFSSCPAVIILTLYAFFLHFISCILYDKKICLKFW